MINENDVELEEEMVEIVEKLERDDYIGKAGLENSKPLEDKGHQLACIPQEVGGNVDLPPDLGQGGEDGLCFSCAIIPCLCVLVKLDLKIAVFKMKNLKSKDGEEEEDRFKEEVEELEIEENTHSNNLQEAEEVQKGMNNELNLNFEGGLGVGGGILHFKLAHRV